MTVLDLLIKFSAKDGGLYSYLERTQNSIVQTERKTTRFTDSIGGGLKNAFMSLPGAQFFTNPIVALTDSVGTVANMGMKAEATAKSFDVLAGSEERASKLLADIKGYKTLFPTDQLYKASQTMLGFGINVENVMPNLKRFGNIAGTDTDRFQSLILAFSQATSTGKLQGQDLLQMINAGWNPLNDIAKITGKSMSEVKEKMGKGQIGVDLLNAALEHATSQGGLFYGMTEKLMQTPLGRFNSMIRRFKERLLGIYDIIQPYLMPAFDAFSAVLDVVFSSISGVLSVVTWFISALSDGNEWVWAAVAAFSAYNAVTFVSTTLLKGWTIAERLQFFWMTLVTKAQWLLNLAMTANPIGLIVAGIAALIAVLVVCYNKFETFRAIVKTVWDAIKGFANLIKDVVIARIKELLSGIGSIGSAILKLFKGDFKGAYADTKQGVKALSGVGTAKMAYERGKEIINGIGDNYAKRLSAEVNRSKGKEKSTPENSPISTPGLSGSIQADFLKGGKKGKNGKNTTESAITGGTRNTTINLQIGKLIETFTTYMNGVTDRKEIEKLVLEAINRAIEIGLSSARS